MSPAKANGWSPTSWQGKQATQQAEYPDADAVERVVQQMAQLPPLVTSWEVEKLRALLARAARGELFVLQGGDCAESFEDCTPGPIADRLKVLLQMSLVLVHATRRPVVRIGRMAGQYAKPRSQAEEQRDGVTLPSYRGDLVNRSGFTLADRTPDPELMLRAYERAGLTLNFVRALTDAGFADLHHPENWQLSFVEHSPHAEAYQRIVASIRDAVEFVEAIEGGRRLGDLTRVEFFTSHEGLALLYEQAQTRQVPRRHGWYNLSTHFPWIGMRTTDPDGAHVEYFRGIRNPIALKVGPSMTRPHLLRLLDLLHPDDEPGRLTLIHRFGAAHIAEGLPPLIETVRSSGKTVLWCADPMHGNTETTPQGAKTRRFDNIVAELEAAFDIHQRMGSVLGGVHLELTGENVTECVGGARGLSEADLQRAYRSTVDPRLNGEQALEVAMRIAQHRR